MDLATPRLLPERKSKKQEGSTLDLVIQQEGLSLHHTSNMSQWKTLQGSETGKCWLWSGYYHNPLNIQTSTTFTQHSSSKNSTYPAWANGSEGYNSASVFTALYLAWQHYQNCEKCRNIPGRTLVSATLVRWPGLEVSLKSLLEKIPSFDGNSESLLELQYFPILENLHAASLYKPKLPGIPGISLLKRTSVQDYATQQQATNL